MKHVGSREFQGSYHRLTEPVIVLRRGKEMGRWYPAGYDVTITITTKPRRAYRKGAGEGIEDDSSPAHPGDTAA